MLRKSHYERVLGRWHMTYLIELAWYPEPEVVT